MSFEQNIKEIKDRVNIRELIEDYVDLEGSPDRPKARHHLQLIPKEALGIVLARVQMVVITLTSL